MRSIGVRFLVVGLLAVLMYIPMTFVAGLSEERKSASEQVIRSVGEEWGGKQAILGPVLVVPVTRLVTERRAETVVDPETGITQRDENGGLVTREFNVQVTKTSDPLFLLPQDLSINASSQNKILNRGIYEVPVFEAAVEVDFNFDFSQVEGQILEGETLHWDQSKIVIKLYTNRSLRGEAKIEAGGQRFQLNPQPANPQRLSNRQSLSGIEAQIGDPRDKGQWNLSLEMNGAKSLMFAALGLQTDVTLVSDWPNPSFQGAFLPTSREVSDTGFEAQWSIPHLARTVAQIGRGHQYLDYEFQVNFGVDFFKPNSFYKKAYSASQYALLFIGLTFLTVMLMTSGREQGVHPVQYLLIGLAKGIFVILMLAYSEHFGFNTAFALASGATITLLTLYGWSALRLGVRTWALFALLVIVYAIQFLILQSQDFALLAGGTLAFFALAAAMYFTRNEQWFQSPKSGDARGWLGRSAAAAPQIKAGDSKDIGSESQASNSKKD